jgi:glycosyltransferase involved in cell wall biosynthesis
VIKVSAIVSLYNAAEFVEGCLEDLVQQTLFQSGNLEIVVIDSNSPQDERSIVERYQKRYANIVYHRTAQRETLYQAWNRGISLARGEYITNANADDRHHPRGIDLMLSVLETQPSIGVVYGDVYESCVPNQSFADNPRTVKYYYPEFFAPLSLLFHQFGCQPLWRKRIHDTVGMFDGEMRAAGDWEFTIRCSIRGIRARKVQHVLGSFLNRADSISTQDATSEKEQALVRARYLNKVSILALYKHEGYAIETPDDQAQVYTDFMVQACATSLPWRPGPPMMDPNAALVAAQAALEVASNKRRALWNYGVVLFHSGFKDVGMQFLENGLEPSLPNAEASYAKAQRGEPVKLPVFAL